MRTRLILWLTLFALTPFVDSAALKIHIISGAKEYQSEASMKSFSKWMAKYYDVKFTASWGHDGIERLPNLDALADADVMFVFARRMKLGEAQMKLIRAHWAKGKAVVGVRTASHAFQKADNDLFDRKVMGGNYLGHFGDAAVKVTNVGEHPVLRRVGIITSDKLYKAGPLAKTAVVLQQGEIGEAKHAVTWVNEVKGRRVFYTSLGVPSDFKNEHFRRMLANAIFWTAKITQLEKPKKYGLDVYLIGLEWGGFKVVQKTGLHAVFDYEKSSFRFPLFNRRRGFGFGRLAAVAGGGTQWGGVGQPGSGEPVAGRGSQAAVAQWENPQWK